MYCAVKLFYSIYFLNIFLGLSSCEIQTINILHIHDNNNVAINAIVAAQKYVNNNEKQFHVALKALKTSHDDNFPKDVCHIKSELNELHIILDTTKALNNFELARTFLRRLAYVSINVVSSTYRNTSLDNEEKNFQLKYNCKCDENQRNNHLSIIEPIYSMRLAIRSVVTHFNMTNAAIFYDDSFYTPDIFITILRDMPIRHVTKRVFSKVEVLRSLKTYRKFDIFNFIILAKSETVRFVLHSIPNEYFRENFQWIVICPDNGEILKIYKNINAKLLLLRPIPKDPTYFKEIRDSLANLTSKNELLTGFYFDLMLQSIAAVRTNLPPEIDENSTKCTTNLHPMNTSLDLSKYSQQSIYGHFKTSSENFLHYEFDMSLSVISVANNLSNEFMGTWTSNSSLNITNVEAIGIMKTKPIYRIYTVLHSPFMMQDPHNSKHFYGFCIDLIDEIATRMNFNYDIFVLNKTGRLNENGQWDGIVEKLRTREADIGLGAISIMSDRETVIDFTVPFYDLTGIGLMIKLTAPPENLFSFLAVLETDVWLSIFAAYLLTSVLLWTFDRWSEFRCKTVDDESRVFDFQECLWFCITSLTPQGGGEAPKSLSAKLITATWWFFGFIIVSSYTANLAAFFTIKRYDKQIESLDDLTEQYNILYAPLNNTFELQYFQRMANIEKRFYAHWKDISLNDSLTAFERSELAVWDYPGSDMYMKILQVFETAGLPNTLEEAVERVRNSTTSSGFAFLGDAIDIRYLTMTNCDLQMVGEEFCRRPYAIAVQQGSPLKEQIDAIILELLSTRYMDELKKKWWSSDEAELCEDFQKSHFDGISLYNIGGIFFVIILGSGLSGLSLLFEFLWYRRKNSIVSLENEEMQAEEANVTIIMRRHSYG